MWGETKMVEQRFFPAQLPHERVYLVLRKHWFTYLTFWFLAIVMLIPAVWGLYFWSQHSSEYLQIVNDVVIMGGTVYLLGLLGLMLFSFVDFYLDVYIITDKRIVAIAQNGLFKRTVSELNLRQIQDIKSDVNGFWATLLHFGNIRIETAGELPNFDFINIGHPYETSKIILDLHEKYIEALQDDSSVSPSPKFTAKKFKDETGAETDEDEEDINFSSEKIEEKAESKEPKLNPIPPKSPVVSVPADKKPIETPPYESFEVERCRKILDGIDEIKKSTVPEEGELKEGQSVELHHKK